MALQAQELKAAIESEVRAKADNAQAALTAEREQLESEKHRIETEIKAHVDALQQQLQSERDALEAEKAHIEAQVKQQQVLISQCTFNFLSRSCYLRFILWTCS